ncbi:hypothetical protein C440_05083 [Haloferax mucosum ATCC BAA-1512]|uniref:CAAX prenyl protease 2/Lysostaphin resistance protein A-like domain-containing protein n=1 Tax=Haloferax mucosum ATCC BAA-1512 TaxID=662479 RepID=M0IM30_9EURY|nr:CPBP family intramembrane glutamic endopeptidase [Haloferax mucosum]ELZ96494.1 hypothetical protein C440_05083 [Haloferax mucosum ATCC BAA-1512]
MAHDSARASGSPGDHFQAYGGIIIVVTLALIVGGTFGNLTRGLVTGFLPATNPLVGALSSAAQFVGFGVVGFGYLSARNDWDLVRFDWPTRGDLVWIVGGIVALFGVYFGATILMNVLNVQGGNSVINQQGQRNPAYFLYLTVVTIVLVGPMEELIFRGIVFGELRRLWGPVPGIVLSSLVFASIHLWSFSGDGMYVSLGLVFVLGGVLAVLYEKSGNLLVAAVVHGLFNAVQFVVSYLQATGMV